jgi:4a-hydroxytetrahydrobiopterin dehydratase
MPALSSEELEAELANLPGWERAGEAITRQFKFDTYMDGVAFANCIAEAAEQANHHPDILIGYRAVTISLTSHDSGGVTARDVRMARTVDGVATP